MSNPVTLAQLRTRIRERCDMEHSDFISDSELLTYINQSYGELYEIIVSRFSDYFTEDTAETIATGSSVITLPTDFFKLKGVDKSLGGGDYQTLTQFRFNERNSRNRNYRRLSQYPLGLQYRIVGNEIRIEPKDSAPGDYRLWYTPMFTKLVDETDTIEDYNGWSEYVVIDASIKCLAKEESSTTHLMSEKKAILERIEEMASDRDIGEPDRISDTYSTDYDDGFYY